MGKGKDHMIAGGRQNLVFSFCMPLFARHMLAFGAVADEAVSCDTSVVLSKKTGGIINQTRPDHVSNQRDLRTNS
jgi:hypothetical protein